MNFSNIFTSAQSYTITLPVVDISSSFCDCCGVDVVQFSHEFWCRHSN
ncbi:hypothetical protein INT47_006184 [Mucor saturninus]|uniref:Uncharacterized protein n=1 Tax=Mucor saturninus TaxID=64648 RepID=A0A8H7V9H1_9FUNG|nr:hypothetical protein INT47_006184 [Mucor saturninus]